MDFMTRPLTYNGHPLSYWYAEYVDAVHRRGGIPLPLVDWAADPAHSPRFRTAFQVADRITV
jgi:hypothetical protein